MKKYGGKILLLLTAFIWGFCLVGQASGMDYMGPWSFTGARMTLGGVSLIILSLILDLLNKKRNANYNAINEYKKAFIPSIICAAPILACTIFQQKGLIYTSVGKVAFVTAFYIFLTPLFGFFIGKKISPKIGIAVVLAMVGLYFITMSGGVGNINKGDIYCLFAAISYAIYILLVDKLGQDIDSVKFSMFQFLTCGLVSFPVAAVVEPGQLTWASYSAAIIPILATGIVSCAGGYTLQIIGQKYTEPNVASIILSGETVFSLLGGFLLLHEILAPIEYFGCAIMVVAIFISVLPERKNKLS